MDPLALAANQTIPLLNRYGGPLGLLGKVVGLGQEDIENGIPWWGWAGVGFVAGSVVVFSLRDKLPRSST